MKRPIKKWCIEHDETMSSLAARVDVGKSHLSRIDKGETGCSLQVASRIAKATRFGVTMADLVKLREGKGE